MRYLLWLILIFRMLVFILPLLIGVIVTRWVLSHFMPYVPGEFFWLVFLFGVCLFAGAAKEILSGQSRNDKTPSDPGNHTRRRRHDSL